MRSRSNPSGAHPVQGSGIVNRTGSGIRKLTPADHGYAAVPAAAPPRSSGADEADASLAARGDQAAFERLYRGNAARIHSLARRMVGEGGADDLTQEVFIRAWEKLGSFRGEAAFGTWLHRLAINHILSRRQTARRREEKQVDAEGLIDRVATTKVAGPALMVDFERALARLPEGARRVFVLHDVEGYKHEEIGGLLGITTGTSKSQLHRARMILRGHLDPEGGSGD
jgi:RNA polymerase sigma-70 factor (ECF subfamily)